MKLSYILQYHNAVVIVLIGVVLVLSGYVFAQTDTGQEIIGEKQEKVLSIDNKELLNADLSNFDMQFKILEINQDNATSTKSNYYIIYAYRDLVVLDNTWQWQDKKKTIELSKKGMSNRDLGEYIAEELSEVAYWRQKELEEKQDKAQKIGVTEKRVVTEYSGLIGKVLDLKNAVFPNYEPVVKIVQIAPVQEPEIPNSKSQIPNNIQIQNPNVQNEMPEPEPAADDVGAQFIAPEPEPAADDVGAQFIAPEPEPAPIVPPIIENATSTE